MNKQFEEWVESTIKITHSITCKRTVDICYTCFYDLPESMQWGVYLEFFDSVGIEILVCDGWYFKITDFNSKYELNPVFLSDDFESRLEAQQEAIKKAFEILNN